MTSGAHVSSIEAIRDFRAAVHTFAQEARDALCTYDVEMRRTLDWLLEDQPKNWQAELRRSEELLMQAKIELQRARSTPLPGGGEPSCMEEKKALERARRRCQFATEQTEAVRKWGGVAERESADYSGRASQLSGMFDADLPRAVALLDRVLKSLEAYTAVRTPAGSQGAELGPASSGVESVARPAPPPTDVFPEKDQPPGADNRAVAETPEP